MTTNKPRTVAGLQLYQALDSTQTAAGALEAAIDLLEHELPDLSTHLEALLSQVNTIDAAIRTALDTLYQDKDKPERQRQRKGAHAP